MMQNSKAHMIGLIAMAMIGMGTSTPERKREVHDGPKETEEERKRRLAQREIKLAIGNGLKEFVYGENSLYALNQKNADKKARKRDWL